VTALLQKVFDRTKCDVEKILSDLDKAVDRQFTAGEKQARDTFTREPEAGMRRYKADRYSAWNGAYLWAKDKLPTCRKRPTGLRAGQGQLPGGDGTGDQGQRHGRARAERALHETGLPFAYYVDGDRHRLSRPGLTRTDIPEGGHIIISPQELEHLLATSPADIEPLFDDPTRLSGEL
jgi:hypothetical protein